MQTFEVTNTTFQLEEVPRMLQHATLSAYYPTLLSLHDYLRCLLPQESWSALMTDRDPHSYRNMLHETVAAPYPADSTVLAQGVLDIGPRVMTQQEVSILTADPRVPS
jgi:hypothetical protein